MLTALNLCTVLAILEGEKSWDSKKLNNFFLVVDTADKTRYGPNSANSKACAFENSFI